MPVFGSTLRSYIDRFNDTLSNPDATPDEQDRARRGLSLIRSRNPSAYERHVGDRQTAARKIGEQTIRNVRARNTGQPVARDVPVESFEPDSYMSAEAFGGTDVMGRHIPGKFTEPGLAKATRKPWIGTGGREGIWATAGGEPGSASDIVGRVAEIGLKALPMALPPIVGLPLSQATEDIIGTSQDRPDLPEEQRAGVVENLAGGLASFMGPAGAAGKAMQLGPRAVLEGSRAVTKAMPGLGRVANRFIPGMSAMLGHFSTAGVPLGDQPDKLRKAAAGVVTGAIGQVGAELIPKIAPRVFDRLVQRAMKGEKLSPEDVAVLRTAGPAAVAKSAKAVEEAEARAVSARSAAEKAVATQVQRDAAREATRQVDSAKRIKSAADNMAKALGDSGFEQIGATAREAILKTLGGQAAEGVAFMTVPPMVEGHMPTWQSAGEGLGATLAMAALHAPTAGRKGREAATANVRDLQDRQAAFNEKVAQAQQQQERENDALTNLPPMPADATPIGEPVAGVVEAAPGVKVEAIRRPHYDPDMGLFHEVTREGAGVVGAVPFGREDITQRTINQAVEARGGIHHVKWSHLRDWYEPIFRDEAMARTKNDKVAADRIVTRKLAELRKQHVEAVAQDRDAVDPRIAMEHASEIDARFQAMKTGDLTQSKPQMMDAAKQLGEQKAKDAGKTDAEDIRKAGEKNAKAIEVLLRKAMEEAIKSRTPFPDERLVEHHHSPLAEREMERRALKGRALETVDPDELKQAMTAFYEARDGANADQSFAKLRRKHKGAVEDALGKRRPVSAAHLLKFADAKGAESAYMNHALALQGLKPDGFKKADKAKLAKDMREFYEKKYPDELPAQIDKRLEAINPPPKAEGEGKAADKKADAANGTTPAPVADKPAASKVPAETKPDTGGDTIITFGNRKMTVRAFIEEMSGNELSVDAVLADASAGKVIEQAGGEAKFRELWARFAKPEEGGGEPPASPAPTEPPPTPPVEPEAATPEWQAFPDELGSLGVPRAEMPQIPMKARGALVNFLKARGIESERLEVVANSLRPTQAEFSQDKVEKVRKAYAEDGETDRAILISSDDYVLDGHHQWMAAMQENASASIPAIRFDAKIADLIPLVKEMPSTFESQASKPKEDEPPPPPEPAPVPAEPPPTAPAAPEMKPEPVEQEAVPVEASAAPVEAEAFDPSKVAEYAQTKRVVYMPPRAIEIDPQRFQFKRGYHQGGATGSLRHIKTADQWKPERFGSLMVWRDPANGRIFVLDGHNRLAKANELGVAEVPAVFSDAPDSKAAIRDAALANIGAGNGTVHDAARFFRSGDYSKEDLAREGVTLDKATAREGLALASIDETLFDAVLKGEFNERWAVMVGDRIQDRARQNAVVQLLARQKKAVTEATVKQLIDEAVAAPVEKGEMTDLFGTTATERSLAVERADVAGHIEKSLRGDARLHGLVAKPENAAKLAEAGSAINVEGSEGLSAGAKSTLALFSTLKHGNIGGKYAEASASIREALNSAAEQLAAGAEPKQVKEAAYARISGTIRAFVEGREIEKPEIAQGVSGGAEAGGDLFAAPAPEERIGKPTAAEAVSGEADLFAQKEEAPATKKASFDVEKDRTVPPYNPNASIAEEHLRRLRIVNEAMRASKERARREFLQNHVVKVDTGNGTTSVLHPSTRPGVKYQITDLDKNGEPWGHREYNNLDEAIEQWDIGRGFRADLPDVYSLKPDNKYLHIYESRSRPLVPGALPTEGLVELRQGGKFGRAVYDHALSEEELAHFSFEPVGYELQKEEPAAPEAEPMSPPQSAESLAPRKPWEMTPEEREARIERLRADNKAVLSTPLMSEGSISPTQVNRMGEVAKARWQADAQRRMEIESEIRALKDPEPYRRNFERRSRAEAEAVIQAQERRIEDLTRLGEGKRGIRLKYQRGIDEARQKIAEVLADFPDLKTKPAVVEELRAKEPATGTVNVKKEHAKARATDPSLSRSDSPAPYDQQLVRAKEIVDRHKNDPKQQGPLRVSTDLHPEIQKIANALLDSIAEGHDLSHLRLAHEFGGEDSPGGVYSPAHDLIALVSRHLKDRNPYDALHEIFHSVEKLMSPEQRLVARAEWRKAVETAIKAHVEAGKPKQAAALRAALRGDTSLIGQFRELDSLRDASEFAADALARLEKKRGVAPDSAFGKLLFEMKDVVSRAWQAIKQFFGGDVNEMERLWRDVRVGKMERGTGRMLRDLLGSVHEADEMLAIHDPDQTRNLPDWAREEMQRRGIPMDRPFNDIDIRDPAVREAIKSDPMLSEEKKADWLKTDDTKLEPALSPRREAETAKKEDSDDFAKKAAAGWANIFKGLEWVPDKLRRVGDLGIKADGNKHPSFLQAVSYITRMLSVNYGAPEKLGKWQDEMRGQRLDAEIEANGLDKDFRTMMKQVGPEYVGDTYAWATRDLPASALPPEWTASDSPAWRARQKFDSMARRLLELDVLGEAAEFSVKNNLGEYVSRRYWGFMEKHFLTRKRLREPGEFSAAVDELAKVNGVSREQAESDLNSMIDGVEATLTNKQQKAAAGETHVASDVLMRRKWNDMPAMRKFFGEVADLRRASVMGIYDVAAVTERLHLMKRIADDPELSSSNETMYNERQAKRHLERMPNERVFGEMAGRWVSPETKHALTDTYLAMGAFGKFMRAIIKPFKIAQTALSTGAQSSNVLSNIFVNSTAARNSPLNPAKWPNFIEAARSQVKKDERFREWLHVGGLKDSYVDSPKARTLLLSLDEAVSHGQTFGEWLLNTTPRWVENTLSPATDFYRATDTFFRYAATLNYMKAEGMSMADATARADLHFQNYGKVVPFAQHAFRLPIAGPFLAFSADLNRTMYNMVKHEPIIAMGMFALMKAVNKGLLTMDEEDREKFAKTGALRPGYESHSTYIPLVVGEGKDAKLVNVAADRWFPAAQWFNSVAHFGDLKGLMLSDPAWGGLLTMAFGKDFSGMRELPTDATLRERITEGISRFASGLAPPLTPGIGYEAKRLQRAFTGEVDRLGRTQPMKYAIPGLLGVRPRESMGDVQFRQAVGKMSAGMKGRADAWRHKVQIPSLSASDAAEIARDATAKIREYEQQFAELDDALEATLALAPGSHTAKSRDNIDDARRNYSASVSALRNIVKEAMKAVGRSDPQLRARLSQELRAQPQP